MDKSNDISRYLIPNIASDPSVGLAGSQAKRFDVGLQSANSLNQQAYGVEYQVPYAIRNDAPLVISGVANSVGVGNPVGNGTGLTPGSPFSITNNFVNTIALFDHDVLVTNSISSINFLGSGFTITNDDTDITITFTGGGGTPASPDTSVQFNDGGSFGGDATFLFDRSTVTLLIDGGSITGGTGPLNITTDTGGDINVNGTTGTSFGSFVNIYAGPGPAGAGTFGGGINIVAGDSGNAASTHPGNILIQSGSNPGGGEAGGVRIRLGDTAGAAIAALIVEQTAGSAGPNIMFGSGASGLSDFGSGRGMLLIKNRTAAPSGNPSGGGVLYTESGALMFKGSGGTVTTVAPA